MLDLDNVAPPNRNAYQMNVLNSSGQLNTTLSGSVFLLFNNL